MSGHPPETQSPCTKRFYIGAYHQLLLSPGLRIDSRAHLVQDFHWGPAVPVVVAKGPPLARALPLPPGLVPAPLNDVANGAEDRVLHGRSCPWPDYSQSSRRPFLVPQPLPAPQHSYSSSTAAPTGLSPAWVVLGLAN